MPFLVRYTPDQLAGNGIEVASFPSTGPFSMRFSNPGNPAYITIAQVTGKNPDGSIPYGTTDYVAGSISNLDGGINDRGVVMDKYKLAVAIPQGSSSMDYSADDISGTGRVRIKGTGEFTLDIYS